jgi:hypothetical protein
MLVLGIRFLIEISPNLDLIKSSPNYYNFKLEIQWVEQNLKEKLDILTI